MNAKMMVCAARGVIRITVRERFGGVNAPVLGEASFFFVRSQSRRCERHRVEWFPPLETQGVGTHSYRFRVVDQSGKLSKPRTSKIVTID